jgi:hypothetical protein
MRPVLTPMMLVTPVVTVVLFNATVHNAQRGVLLCCTVRVIIMAPCGRLALAQCHTVSVPLIKVGHTRGILHMHL